MKKIVILILSTFFCLCFVACGNEQKYTIDNYTWVMSSIQSIEQNGDFVAYSPSDDTFDKAAYPNALAVDMVCNAKNGSLSILDKTNGKTYRGTYKTTKRSPQTTIYEIVIEEKSGTAVVSVTRRQDGTGIPSMILSVSGYALNFQSE